MAYLIDRQRVLYSANIVAMIRVRQRKTRTCAILSDNSLYHTLTRTITLMARAREPVLGGVGRDMTQPHSKRAIWWARR